LENLEWDKTKFVSNKDVFDFLITRKPELTDISTPNTHFTYCNTNYALLALLIEKISGTDYAAYLSNTFFKPLKMENSYVFTLADTLKATPSYNWRGTLESFNFLDRVYGDKNIYTTPEDLLIWDRALSSHIIFRDETLQQAYSPYSNEKPGIRNYGLGWRMNLFSDGNKMIYHNGWWHGSNATFIRLIKEQATIIVIGNKFTRSVYDAKILTSLFGNYYTPVEEEALEILKDTLSVFNSAIKKDTLQKINVKSRKRLTAKQPGKNKKH
jgi:CubicO group peptidase (beta-lactamase class C family)